MRLARAMGCLTCSDEFGGERKCRVTLCMARELHDVESGETRWEPFDPGRLESLEERVEKLRRRVEWRRRVGSS